MTPSTDTELDRQVEALLVEFGEKVKKQTLAGMGWRGSEPKAQIKQLVARERQALIEKVSSADFVYEVMNAPTNGVARDWIKAELQAQADKGDK